MPRRYPRLWFVGPVALTSLCLLALSIVTALVLYHQQGSITEELTENVDSRHAASDLEDALRKLSGVVREGNAKVAPLHDEVADNLKKIHDYADKDEEQKQADDLDASFREYLAARRSRNIDKAADILQNQTLPLCVQLRDFNAQQIEKSADAHSRALRYLAWGLVAVGGAAALTGLFLGYGVARGLSLSIRRLQFHVQDAAGKLGNDLPAIVLTEEGDLGRLHEQVEALVGQVEQVVERLRQREREVLRAEQLAAVGQLAASVAHEIRNPLTTIKMLIQGVREEVSVRALSPADLEVIESEVRRIERSLKTFLDFARPPRLERAPLDLVTLVEQTLGLIRGRAAKQHVVLAFRRPDGPVPVEADGEQLRQVLVNLMLNALDALPRGGRLEIDLRNGGEREIEVSVEDSGPGIAPEMMPRLFTPFASTKETGLGLGLVVSRRIVEDHGGRLWAVNRPEGGARFTFRLPAA
jgi:signal transduction histidine kinase